MNKYTLYLCSHGINIAAKVTLKSCFSAPWRESKTVCVCQYIGGIQHKSSPGNFKPSTFSLSSGSLPALSLVQFRGSRKQVERETGYTDQEIDRQTGETVRKADRDDTAPQIQS